MAQTTTNDLNIGPTVQYFGSFLYHVFWSEIWTILPDIQATNTGTRFSGFYGSDFWLSGFTGVAKKIERGGGVTSVVRK
jgi:hypothetical protein